MPTYEYRCVSCEHQFERFQRMSDDPVKECEVCGEPVKRLLFPVAIHFKGNGFYSTDYAKKSSHRHRWHQSTANGASAGLRVDSGSASDWVGFRGAPSLRGRRPTKSSGSAASAPRPRKSD